MDNNNNNKINNDTLNLLDFNSYRKYIDLIKIYYDKHDNCPTDSKLKIKKVYKDNKIFLSCDEDNFSYEIILPKYINIYKELNNQRIIRDKSLFYFKSAILYGKDKEQFDKYKADYIKSVAKIEKYNNILSNDSKNLMELDKNMFNLKDKLNKIYNDRKIVFDKLKNVDNITKKKIVILFSKKYPINDSEIEKNRKALNVSFENLKNWLEWLSTVKLYIKTVNEYNLHYNKYKKINNKMKEKNNAWMDVDPIVINNANQLNMIKKYKNVKQIKNLKNKTSGKKKIKIKIKK